MPAWCGGGVMGLGGAGGCLEVTLPCHAPSLHTTIVFLQYLLLPPGPCQTSTNSFFNKDPAVRHITYGSSWDEAFKKKIFHSPLVGNLGYFTRVRLRQPQEQCYPFLPMCAVFPHLQTIVWLPFFFFLKDFLMCPQMLMHATPHRVSYLGFYTVNHCGYIRVNAHRGCMNTVRESTLQVDSGKKIPCCNGESNQCQ